MDTSSMVEFKLDADGKLAMEGGTVLEFDDRLPTHRALDVVRELEGDIRAKVDGKFTDGDRYRAMRAMAILAERQPDMAQELDDKLKAFEDTLPEEATEPAVDAYADHLIELLNAKIEEITAKQDAELLAQADAARAEGFVGDAPAEQPSTLIYIPEPRKLRVPETTLVDPTDA